MMCVSKNQTPSSKLKNDKYAYYTVEHKVVVNYFLKYLVLLKFHPTIHYFKI